MDVFLVINIHTYTKCIQMYAAKMGWFGRRCSNIGGSPWSSGREVTAAPSGLLGWSPSAKDNIQYLGGSDKVDINNANIQADWSRQMAGKVWAFWCTNHHFYRWYKPFPNGLFIIVLPTLHILGDFFWTAIRITVVSLKAYSDVL